MSWEREIEFVRRLLDRYHIQTLRFRPSEAPEVDLGLRRSMHLVDLHSDLFQQVKERTLYGVVDTLRCRYNALLLPDTGEIFLIGPYLTHEVTEQDLAAVIEKNSLPSSVMPLLKQYYASLSVMILSESVTLGLMDTLAEAVWGRDEPYDAVFYDGVQSIDVLGSLDPEQFNKTISAAELRLMEERYTYEKQLMHAVSSGMTHQAQMIISKISEAMLEPRTMDSLRNVKNYGIICNTLMRKAAEEGGVHPFHIDQLSSTMARKMENIRNTADGMKLFQTMVHKYCLLVRNHSMKQYSQLVQHVILRIETDLTADLSLAAHAAFLNVNSSYLSTLFRRETGITLTEYVNRQRVEHSLFLLNATDMQIQNIAQLCGIPDVNYFTKTFKRIIGKTPKEYRRDTRQSNMAR